MTTLESVNQRVTDKWGYHPITGLPNYKVILVTDKYPTEKRHGEFNIFLKGTDIFLKTETGVSEVLKYPGWEGFFVVEWLTYNQHHDVMSGATPSDPRFIYEPVWRFYDQNDKPQPLHYESVDFIIRMHKESMRKKWIKTDAQHKADDDAKKREESAYIRAALDRSDVEDHLHWKSGVKLDSTKIFRG